ncbi:MAG: excinuclease ABC subunit A, partial [Planctomycetales bacterium]|nr:excinuclease ABC subunit A [Planctomycetales bacterium]
TYARQFLGQMPKPDVDSISGLAPSISIQQKSTSRNPRSTVGTITEIHDYLRVLFARVGQGYCYVSGKPIRAQSTDSIIDSISTLPAGTKFQILAPIVQNQKGEFRDLFVDLRKRGYLRARVDGEFVSLADELNLRRHHKHTIDVVIDRLIAGQGQRSRLAEAVEQALQLADGRLICCTESTPTVNDAPEKKSGGRQRRGSQRTTDVDQGTNDRLYSAKYACAESGMSYEPPSPQLFSFNSPQGMCVTCDGLGQLFSFDPDLLIPDERLSFKRGAIELVGPWKEMGRWRRHIFQGVADTMERKLGLAAGTMLETPWCELDEPLRQLWLHGTGDEHITFQWRGGASPIKYGGKFDGVVPDLLAKYRGSKSKPQLRQLEKYMRSMGCPDCGGQRLNRQARAVKLTSGHPWFADQPTRSLPEVCRMSIADASDFFSELRLDPTRAVIAAE